MVPINIRVAQISDASSVAQFINRAYRGESSQQGWTTEATILDGQRTDAIDIIKIIEEEGNQILLFEEASILKGSVHLKKLSSDVLYFGMLVVLPEGQNRGLGKLILAHIDQYAKAAKFKKIRISVIHTRSELIAYYERRGFKATGKSEPFPYGDIRFGIPKINDLKFLEFEKEIIS